MNKRRISIIVIGSLLLLFLVLLLVIVRINIAEKRTEKKGLVLEQTKMKEELSIKPEIKLPLPQIEDVTEEEYLAKESIAEQRQLKAEKPLKDVELKELPQEAAFLKLKNEAAEDRVATEAVEQEGLKIHPSAENIEDLKRKGLIIY